MQLPHRDEIHSLLLGWPAKSGGVRARVCKPLKEPKNRFPGWRACMTTLFDVPARQAALHTLVKSIKEAISGLLKGTQD